MKIYHTKTQEDYDALMEELEKEGCLWIGGGKPTNINIWEVCKEDTCVICDNKMLSHWSVIEKDNTYPNILTIEYTAPKPRVEKNSVKDLVKEASKDNKEIYHTIIQELEQTYLAKNADYGNSFEQSLDEFGEVAGTVRIGDKFNRAKNLMNNKPKVKDESKIDTWLDMTNYCIMQAMWLMKQEG